MERQNERPDEIADALSLIVWGLLLIGGGVGAIAGWLTLGTAQFLFVGMLLVPIGMRLGAELLCQVFGRP